VVHTLHSLYNALWYPALPLALIGSRGAVAERLGRAASPLAADGRSPRLWYHAASVGEVEAVSAIVTEMCHALPHSVAVTTSMTVAGREAARRRIPAAAASLLAPLDCAPAVRSFVSKLRPNLVVVAETELWPNYFREGRRYGARIAIVNGRISPRAFTRYLMFRPLFAAALDNVDLVLAQSAPDAARYRMLGAPRRRVIITGNTKFDLALAAAQPQLRPALSALGTARRLFIAGSTAPGEEAVVIEAWRMLKIAERPLTLVIAPRHIERAAEISRLVDAAGLPHLRASTLSPGHGAEASVVLLDTIGDLRSLYCRAAAAFVGGSLRPGRGGQSLAEPAAAALPVLFGPFHENQRQMASALIAAGGGRIVRDAREMSSAINELLCDETRRIAAGRAARRALELLGGAVKASLPLLQSLLAA
jgi:3-deoxy-D-manno-octulosonic-acid transferase